MDYRDETLYTMALTRLPQVGLAIGNQLIDEAGSATALYANRHDLGQVIANPMPRLQKAFNHFDEYLPEAERELDYMARHDIVAYTKTHPQYPHRLHSCHDAPLVLFFYGNTDLNPRHTISIVGSRKATPYGRDFCQQLIADIARQLPQTLIVSGLAYGIDICAHRAALEAGLDTVAVLAHGLDRIYPATHRATASQMSHHGGLLTEYTSGTTPDRMNFVQRNRIVAGMTDATIVIESGERGGSLITAQMAQSYNRDVFALPGRITDAMSRGCNNLIARQEAVMIQSAADLLTAMNWVENPVADTSTPTLFPELLPQLTPDEQRLVEIMRTADSIQVNNLVAQTGLPYPTISAILYELECKDIVELMGGARYRLKSARTHS